MSTKTVTNYLAEKIDWKRTTDPQYPFSAKFEGEKYVIRLNDFPEENLYTLVMNGKEVADFDDWPATWSRPVEKKVDLPSKMSPGREQRPLAFRGRRAFKS